MGQENPAHAAFDQEANEHINPGLVTRTVTLRGSAKITAELGAYKTRRTANVTPNVTTALLFN